ncbi:CRAL-TRIO domain-containing protein [Infundibulicybe gibba]|nr:CRAL-TRIO domain-containing protein [Infundibulicybe gibba]
MTTKTQQVLTSPEAGTKIGPVHNYTEEQAAQIKALREYTNTLILPDTDPYYPWELRWLDRPDTMPRYMRASKWSFADAQKRIKATIEWRRDFQPDLIPPDEVKIESETGKIIVNGFDKDGRPIIYMRPGRENTPTGPRQLRHLVWCLERAKDLMPPGQESVVILVDYKSTTLRTNPSISVARKVLHILQQHYVETLGRALVVNLPMLLNFFYKGYPPSSTPSPGTRSMRFNPDLLELIPASQLDADFGGSFAYEFEPDSYWAQIVSACGIAKDGTRVEKHESINGSKSSPTSISGTSHDSEETVSISPGEHGADDISISSRSKALDDADIHSTLPTLTGSV